MVSRETSIEQGLESIGLGTLATDGDVVSKLLDFARILEDVALPAGFIGPSEAPKILDRHVLESAALAPLLGGASRIVDVGSGAGLPGLVLSIVMQVPVHLVESDLKRVDFLTRTAQDLGLDISIWPERAEAAGHRPELRDQFDAATARALAKPPVALEYALPLVRPRGRAVIAVGPTIHDEAESLKNVAKALAGGVPEIVPLQVPGAPGRAWAMIVEKEGPCPPRFPRRTGVPARRPLS